MLVEITEEELRWETWHRWHTLSYEILSTPHVVCCCYHAWL